MRGEKRVSLPHSLFYDKYFSKAIHTQAMKLVYNILFIHKSTSKF